MNIPVKVKTSLFAKPIDALDDELHSLIHQGIVKYEDAIKSLKDAKLALDQRAYPWLRDVLEAGTDSLTDKSVKAVDDAQPVDPRLIPQIVEVPEAKPAANKAKAADKPATETPADDKEAGA